MSLGNLFLAFFFGLLHSLVQKFIKFCSPALIFLRTPFRQSNSLMFVLRDKWNNKTLNLEHFSPGFLTFFVQGLSYNIPVGIIFYREIENLQILLVLLSPQGYATVYQSIRQSRDIFLLFFFKQ